MFTKLVSIKLQIVCLLCSSLLLSSVHAVSKPYVVIGEGHLAYQYRWRLPDGTILKQGMTDNHGRAFLINKPGNLNYILETTWGEYKVNIPSKCWKIAPNKFESCIYISESEDTEEVKQEAAASAKAEKEREDLRRLRIAWVEKEIPINQQIEIINTTLLEHKKWRDTPIAKFPDTTFLCSVLTLPPPSNDARDSLYYALSLPEGRDRQLAYIKAAELGHWRAAAQLANAALNDEDWESAESIIAWLLKNNVPSGYTKLAEVIQSSAGYDGAVIDESVTNLVTSLRWRASQLGDPLAQSQMSDYFEKQGQTQISLDLKACSQQQYNDYLKDKNTYKKE
jgi:hypothetical protein